MHNEDFIHLHVHSEYSLLDGLGKPEHYINKAKEMGFRALAVTDHANIDAHLRWQKVCKKNGLKPILGCELYLVQDMKSKEKKETRSHITVLVKDLSGWQALGRMLTIANLEGFYHRPRLDFRTFLSNVNSGLVVMTGCSASFLTMPNGVEFLIELGKNRKIDCYLEVMPHLSEGQKVINQMCVELAKKYSIPLVATNDCHYIRAEYAKAQEVLLAIQRQAKWKDSDRWRFEIDGLYLRTADEMIDVFKKQGVLNRAQYYQAMMNTMVIAEKCWNFQLPKKDVNLPLTCYEKERAGIDADKILEKFCEIKRKEFYATNRWNDEYQKRYLYEKEIIKKKGFARYFLIVHEIISWCRKQGIMVGPGRGSVGGSLIAYLLTITQVDPLRYGLLFERFISEDRIDVPDIDLDFEDVKCHLVRQHLEEEYGKYNVVGISTFLRMKGRAVIRDVGRVFDLPVSDVDVFAKSIRAEVHEEDIVLGAGQNTKEGKFFAKKYPKEFGLACVLEGTVKAAGQHPAGLILSAKDLRSGESGSLCQRMDALVCNWDMEDCEHNGLIKIDVLKLGTLTVLNEAKRLLTLQGVSFQYEDLPLDDLKVFQMLSQGNTSGVFQFSGYVCTDLCKKMEVNSFEDMVAITALARPGPAESGMTELYVKRKKGEKWKPLHPIYEAITKDTYGVVIYQEQMIKAMTGLAGFSNSNADQIRKVIGKKRRLQEFEPYRQAFLNGCQEKKTLTQSQAEEFWEGLQEWASYGFVKAHAVEYAMIGYWTAWLKLYHPTEFFCAQLTYGAEKESVIKEAENKGMVIVTPKVGFSDSRHWVAKDKFLYMPFVEIKGIGETQADRCLSVKPVNVMEKTRKGFFGLKESQVFEVKGKLEKLLVDICAFDPASSARPENLLDYFQYSFGGQEDKRNQIEIIRKQMLIDPLVRRCVACELCQQANRVVSSSLGMYNVLVLGEAPGHDEDIQNKGFVGDAGQLLWDEMALHGITRRMIHVGNCCKCWPRHSRTPSKEQIDECFGRWMRSEILSMDCRLILATGNLPLYALTGRESGISSISGQMEWVEKVRAWVVWCVHPSAVLRNRRANVGLFKKGIEVFAGAFLKK